MEQIPLERKNLLLVGASRGLGFAMAEEFLARGWNVIGTVRGTARTRLHELSERSPGRVDIETIDITMPEQIGAMRSRPAARMFDALFVNAGVTNNPHETIAEVATAGRPECPTEHRGEHPKRRKHTVGCPGQARTALP